MNPVIYPNEPGYVHVNNYGWVEVASWEDGFLYDEVSTTTSGAGAIAAGTELTFFRDVQSKTLKQTNMSLSSQLPSGWEMIVLRVALHIQGVIATADVKAVLEYGYVQLLLDNSVVAMEGPATRFPCGWGLNGHLDAGDTAALDIHQFNNGAPVVTAVPPLSIPIIITPQNTFRATLHWYDALSSLSTSTEIKFQMVMHGLKKAPAM